jgi:peptidyl-prolyl cis-trans isomerase A (cyclophilin A)
MQSLSRAILVVAAASLFTAAGFAQQSTAPADQTSTTATQQSAAPSATSQSADQPLPDSPDALAQVSPQPSGPTAVFDTSMGRMTCKLFSNVAPKTVANFVGLAEGTKDWTNPATHQVEHGVPLYNGTIFHRVIPGFMIQGGDPLGTGEGDPGYYINDEFDPNLNFDVAGRLAMANSGPNTDGSQFFITVAAYPSLDQHYTIFGQCDPHSVLVAQTITEVDRDPSNNKPLQPVVLNKVTIVPNGQPMPPMPSSDATPAGAPAAPTAQTNP